MVGRKRSARRIAAGAVAALSMGIVGCSSHHSSAAAASGAPISNSFSVPAAALDRPLGEFPPGPCPSQAAQVCAGDLTDADILKGDYPLDVSGLGVPVGGVGAGSFMINQDGTFGPWDFGGSQDASWEMRTLPQAAFHFREQVGSGAATVRTLAVDGPTDTGSSGLVPQRSWGSPLSAWDTLKPGQGTYSSLYPFGWMSYTPFATNVSMEFYSPIVARQDEPTSLPVVYFDFRLANPTNKVDRISVMFTMPNAPDHVGTTPASVREGFTSSYEDDKATGIQSVTLAAHSPDNTPDAKDSEWTIAAKPSAGERASYTTSWNANGTGADVYAPYSASGTLPDKPIDQSDSAGAISVSAMLKPGQVATVPFVLSWDFPQVSFDNNHTVWMRRYTDLFGAKETAQNGYVAGSYPFHQSQRIADYALSNEQTLLSEVEGWWKPIATDAAYPTLLRTAALNQLYQLVFNNSFWEGGLVSNSVAATGGQRIGSHVPGTHLFDTEDSTADLSTDPSAGLNNSNEMDVDSYGYLAYDLLFPNLEKDRMLSVAEATMLDPYGDPANGRNYVVSSSSDPFITWTPAAKPEPGESPFVDIPSKMIYRYYAYADLGHDPAFLAEVYPAMQKNLAYLQALLPPGGYLPEEPSSFANTYDVIPVNHYDVYNSDLYLLSLEVVIATAQKLGQPAGTIAPLQTDLTKAKAEFEHLFWDPVHQEYRYTPGPSSEDYEVMLDTFFAQQVAQQVALPDLLDPAHEEAQLTEEYSSFMGRTDQDARLLGAPNMALAPGVTTWPAVGQFGVEEETEVWSGTDYFVAATYYNAGKRFQDPTLEQDGIQIGSAVADQIWDVPGNGFAFDAPEAWHENTTSMYRYPAYARALAVWNLLDAISPVPT